MGGYGGVRIRKRVSILILFGGVMVGHATAW